MHQPEPVPEAIVPTTQDMQTAQTPAEQGITNPEQPHEDAVMAEAGVSAFHSF